MVYLLTFNCYGTRLPGDKRGWVERAGGYRDPNPGLLKHCGEVMKQRPYLLDVAKAHIVLDAICEVCRFRNWDLIAAHVRTTHVHVIVDRLQNADRAIVDFKSYSSRVLGSDGIKRWSRGGSTRPLSTPEAVIAAITYVLAQQGEPMALTPAPVQIG
jgi:REP element-mobilizing transposase RayT